MIVFARLRDTRVERVAEVEGETGVKFDDDDDDASCSCDPWW